MEFKGTKGKWEFSENGGVHVTTNSGMICDLITSSQKDKYNALLISKAPEMLEMLERTKVELSRIKGSMMAHPDCTEGSEFDDYTSSAQDVENNIEQLIKEATEL
jgi:hypothetical protein